MNPPLPPEQPGPDRSSDETRLARSIETRVSAAGPEPTPTPVAATSPGRLIESFNAAGTGFRLLRLLGEGGMGAVFVAEQEQPQRQVALKLIHAARATPEMIARFRLEAEVLGRLRHPGIAEIHAAGEARIGDLTLPYLAMELVEGEPLNLWARRHRPDLRTRLALLARVCEAIEHAHQRGVIHRDLKPANILVTPAGEPRVLDFGVARVTDGSAGPDSQLTTAGYVVGTLHYMSPEQTRGDSADVDTRSDVYALGVLGFELLTGELPHAFEQNDPYAVVRAIREQAPRRAGQLLPAARGDIEIILGKALEKERERRYAGAGAMAEDIQRFLEDRSILARAPTLRYRLGKFARRNPALSAALGVALLAVIGGAVMVARFGLAEQAARRLAEAEALKAQATVAFFANLLSKANPAFSRGQDLSVREALGAASAEMTQALASQPEVEASVRQSIGASFNALGSFAEAERELRRAVAVSAHPSVPREVRARSHLTLGQLLADQGRLREASLALAEAEALAEAGLRDAGLALNIAHSRLTLQLGLGEGDELDARSAALLQRARALQPSDPRLIAHIAEAHAVAIERAEPERSLALRREALATLQASQGEFSPETLGVANGLAAALLRLGRFEESAALRDGLHERLLGVLGPDHPAVLGAVLNLAHLRQNRGETVEALHMLEQALAAAERLPESLDVRYRIQQSLSTAYFSLGRLDEAEAAGLAASEGLIRLLGERHEDSVLAMTSLATLLAHRDKPEQAAPWFARALGATEENLGPEHPQTLATLSEYAAFLRDAGRLEESLQRFADLLAVLERSEGPHGPQTLITIYQYGGALQQAGRHAEALPLTRRLHERAAAVLGPGNPFALLAPNRHARSLIGTGELAQAEALLTASWDALSGVGNAQFAGFVAESFVQLAEARGDRAEAARWRAQAQSLLGE